MIDQDRYGIINIFTSNQRFYERIDFTIFLFKFVSVFVSFPPHCGTYGNSFSHTVHCWQKFRESNGFTKEIANKFI